MAGNCKTTGQSTTSPIDNKQRKEILCDSDLLEIDINNTPAVDDDYVQVKCACSHKRYRVPCRIRTRKPGSESVTAVLTNPDGRLRFPDDGDTTKTVTVPGDGSWVDFEISGEKASKALNDALIVAHETTASGNVLAQKPVTVFWFDEAKIDLTPTGIYGAYNGMFTTNGAPAIKHSAQAKIKPDGLNCAAPQISVLKVGIMQNDVTRGVGSETIWSSPTISWLPDVPAGTQITIPARYHTTSSLPVAANDIEPSVKPLYDQPGKEHTLDPNSLMPPINCSGGGPATSYDTPGGPIADPRTFPATLPDGTVVGTITYPVVRTRVLGSFMDWAVIFNTSTQEFCPLRQRAWHVHVDSAVTTPQKATADANDAPVSIQPVLTPTANDLVNDSDNQHAGKLGSEMVTFRK